MRSPLALRPASLSIAFLLAVGLIVPNPAAAVTGTVQCAGFWEWWWVGDIDDDGREEVWVRSSIDNTCAAAIALPGGDCASYLDVTGIRVDAATSAWACAALAIGWYGEFEGEITAGSTCDALFAVDGWILFTEGSLVVGTMTDANGWTWHIAGLSLGSPCGGSTVTSGPVTFSANRAI